MVTPSGSESICTGFGSKYQGLEECKVLQVERNKAKVEKIRKREEIWEELLIFSC